MDNGWIKIHRKITEWEWYDDPNTFRLFFHVLIMANHEANSWHGVVIQRGQFLTSTDKLAHTLKLGRQQIRTSIDKLKSTNEITIKPTSNYSIIEIIKYDEYQQNNQQSNIRVTNEQPTSNQRVTTNKNTKNEKNERIEETYTPSFLEFWKEYPNRVGKSEAYKSWNKLKPSIDEVLKTLAWQKKSDQWCRGFVPNPATYLNQQRWKDEPIEQHGIDLSKPIS